MTDLIMMFSKISVCHFLLLFSLMLCLTRSLCFTIFTCTLCLNFITPLMLYLYLFKLEPEFTTIWVLRRRWGFIESFWFLRFYLFLDATASQTLTSVTKLAASNWLAKLWGFLLLVNIVSFKLTHLVGYSCLVAVVILSPATSEHVTRGDRLQHCDRNTQT